MTATHLAAQQVAEVTDATGVAGSAWLLILFPVVGALILLLGGKATNAWGHLLGCATVVASFVYGLMLFFSSTGLPDDQRVQNLHLFDWIPVDQLQVEFGLRIDPGTPWLAERMDLGAIVASLYVYRLVQAQAAASPLGAFLSVLMDQGDPFGPAPAPEEVPA